MAFPIKSPQFQNYTAALFGSRDFLIPMKRPIINSTIITISGHLAGCFLRRFGRILSEPVQGAFARVIFVLVGIALYLPYQAVIIPLTTITAKAVWRIRISA